MATIHLIRHGQAQFGMEDYDALSSVGIEQSKYLGEVLKQRGTTVSSIYSGNMKRQIQTAVQCMQVLGFGEDKLIQTDHWDEFNHREILTKYDTRYSDIKQVQNDVILSPDPKQKIKEILTGAVGRWTGGEFDDYNESWNAFGERIQKGLDHIISLSKKEDHIFVFTSGGAISVVLQKVLDLSLEKTFELQLFTANASITKIKTSSRGLQLLSFNDHSHFEGEKKNWLTFR
ncbi:MAG: hypothetical protein JWN78_3355 [Bacteroidota bacterium]|nr:hypothetical protein [Bacteroidota bacterium]